MEIRTRSGTRCRIVSPLIRYQSRAFARVRSYEKGMRVLTFMPLKGAARHEDPISLVNLFRTVLFRPQGENLEVIHGL